MAVERTEYDRVGREWGKFYYASTDPNLTLNKLRNALTSPNKFSSLIDVMSAMRFMSQAGEVFVYKYSAGTDIAVGSEHARRVNSIQDLVPLGSYSYKGLQYVFPGQTGTHNSGVMEFNFDLTEPVEIMDNNGRTLEVWRQKLLVWVNNNKDNVFLHVDHLPPQSFDFTAMFVKERIINRAVVSYCLEMLKGYEDYDDTSLLYETGSTKIVVLDFSSEANLLYIGLSQGKFDSQLVVSLIQEKMAPYANNRFVDCIPSDRYVVLLLEGADSPPKH